MEVTLGVLSIYSSESKDTPLQRDHVPLCDIQENTAHGQRSHSFVLKRPGRKPIYLEVDTETGKLATDAGLCELWSNVFHRCCFLT